MTLVSELDGQLQRFDYTDITLRGPAFHEAIAQLRAHGWLAAGPFGYIVLERLLAEHPEQWQLLAEHPELAGQAVEESLRYEPVTPFTARIVEQELTLRDVTFPAGIYGLTELRASFEPAPAPASASAAS